MADSTLMELGSVVDALLITVVSLSFWARANMNWPYTMGAAHLYTWPLLQQIARDDYGMSDVDLEGRPFNQLKNYVWSQLGQIALYEVLLREGFDAARATVMRLVDR